MDLMISLGQKNTLAEYMILSGTDNRPPRWTKTYFVFLYVSPGDDLIVVLNKAMAFLTVASSRFPITNTQHRTSFNPRNQATIQDGRVTVQQVQGRQGQNYSGLILIRALIETDDLDTYDSDCDDISNAKAVLMANISNYGSDVISEVPHSETYLNDMDNQSVHALQDFEQTQVVDFIDNEIHSDSNIISYSQYLQETQLANEKANKEQDNESVTAELERYKEQVKTFEQRLNIDLSSREKMIDSQMDDMIKEKLAL
ncbi:hypothetical protein Tco_0849208, partial [Tanacetum coccineum]